MAPKTSSLKQLKALSRKNISSKKAAAVKGGARKQVADGRLAGNHNLTVM